MRETSASVRARTAAATWRGPPRPRLGSRRIAWRRPRGHTRTIARTRAAEAAPRLRRRRGRDADRRARHAPAVGGAVAPPSKLATNAGRRRLPKHWTDRARRRRAVWSGTGTHRGGGRPPSAAAAASRRRDAAPRRTAPGARTTPRPRARGAPAPTARDRDRSARRGTHAAVAARPRPAGSARAHKLSPRAIASRVNTHAARSRASGTSQ